MRIAINGRVLIKNKLDGIGYFTLEVVRRFVANYPENDYLVFYDRQPDPEVLIQGSEIQIVAPQARHPILYLLWFEGQLPRRLNKWRADLFLSFDGFISLWTKVPTIVCIHDLAYTEFPQHVSWATRWHYRLFQKKYARKARHVLTVSNFSKQDLIRKYQLDAHKIHVVYNGSRFENEQPNLHVEILDKLNLHQSRYFLYIGSHHPRKNIENLLAGFEQFCSNHPDCDHKLVLVGRKAWKTTGISRQIQVSHFRHRIITTGYLSDPEMWTLLTHTSLFCYVSLWEGFGVPVLDALHAEVPILCSNTTSLPEVIGEVGTMVDPTDIKEIATQMYAVVNSKILKKQLKEKYDQQRSKYSWERTVKSIYNSCEDIVRK